jgi:hypothetical protein
VTTRLLLAGLLAAALPAALVPAGCDAIPPAHAAPAGDSGRLLDQLQVAARTTGDGYTDKSFPHWSKQPAAGKGCDTREAALIRDGKDVKVDGQCKPIAGHWISPYDSETWTHVSDVDIDHVVPRKHAWVSGAAKWTPAEREAFANDLQRPELLTVTDNVNQAKGDKAPDQWKPPAVAAWCRYASDWITVKHYYRVTVTTAEKAALVLMLKHCGKGT